MIPVRLAMRNFMPYRDNVPPLQFAGIHTASISGDNGNGKSALIDAMTWALWGKTRAKSDDDLIHLGQTETEVEFDFAVGQQLYRVIRKHARPRSRRTSGQTILEFQIAANGTFKSITGNTIRETQQEIIKVLHIDYSTFINSALLLQGRADEFTIADPAKRKQVLADILRLSLYDELAERAKEMVRQQEGERTLAESSIKDIDDELAQKPVYEAGLEQAQTELSVIEKTIGEQESGLKVLRQRRESLEDKRRQLAEAEESIGKAEAGLKQWTDMLEQHNSRIKDYEELIARRASIEEGYNRFQEARKLKDELDGKLTLVNKLSEHRHQLEIAIERAQAALVTEHKLAESKIAELEAGARKLPQLKDELQQVQAELGRLAGEEETLRRKRETGQEMRAHLHGLETGNGRLEREIAEIEEKLGLLLAGSEAKCPLCETELGEESLELIEKKYTAEKQEKADSLKSSRDEAAQKKIALETLEGEISRLEVKLNQESAAAQSQAGRLSREIAEVEKAGSQLGEARENLTEIEERLAGKDFAASEQETLSRLEAELATLGYDSQQHEEVRHRLTGLEQYEDPRRRLEEADRLIVREKESASRAEQAVNELKSSLEADKQKREGLIVELGSLPQLESDLERAEAEYRTLSARQRQAQEAVGSVKGKLERCAELEIRRQEREERLGRAVKEEKIYRDLAQAFGKKGIQALLIEMALPEIEVEANRLLGRMTDDRMSVKIETQRETKKGDVVETLDIKIADELGTRNYEMFSGGEAFRINFAIRIALSKLLARRAGAPLPTVIIDEGFGTQDSTGLEKVKEAITSIQDDFEKILVITHIDEFRDAFPARIDVIKTPEGSTIEVS